MSDEATDLHPLGRLPEDWQPVLAALGEPPYRARQVFRWLHNGGATDVGSMTNLPRALRERLRNLDLSLPAEVLDVHRAADGTRKIVLGMADDARVECVVIPMTKEPSADADVAAAPDDDEDEESERRQRVTLCISTQFGCAMGCTFCASGRAGLTRGLTAAEIVAQVMVAKSHLEPNEYLRNLVFMGMGEPLHHYDETARAIRLLTHAEGHDMSPRRITVSTVGLVPGIRRLGQDFDGKVGLAVSLHAPDDATRDRIVPMNQRYPIRDLLQALREYPLPRRRRITIEYTLIDGQNDGAEHARALAALLRGLKVKVNLIPMNPVEGSGLSASKPEVVARFREALAGAGLSCFVRTRRGDDVSAACGQLAMKGGDVPAERLRGIRRQGR